MGTKILGFSTANKNLYRTYEGGKTIDLGSGSGGINLYRPFLALVMLFALLKKIVQPISATSDTIGNS